MLEIPAECVCGNPVAVPKSVERACAKLPRPRARANGVPPTLYICCLEPVYKRRVHVVEQEYLQLSRTSRTSRCRLSIHKRNTPSTRCASLGTLQRPLPTTSGTPPCKKGWSVRASARTTITRRGAWTSNPCRVAIARFAGVRRLTSTLGTRFCSAHHWEIAEGSPQT